MTRFTVLTALLAGCWTSSQTPDTKQPTATDVRVELAAVTLGDDCGDHGFIPPPIAMAPAEAPMPPPPGAAAPCNPSMGSCGGSYVQHCDQTSMQLSLRASDGSEPTNVRVKLVELLDTDGKLLAKLAPRSPTRWTTDGSYTPWDQTIAPNQTLAASYSLSAPDWNTLTGSRWNAHSKTFQLRVILTIGSKDRTVDRQSITPAMLPPPVPT